MNEQMLDEASPTRIAAPAGDISMPPEYQAAESRVAEMGEKLYKGPEFTGAVESKDAALQELFSYDQSLEKSQAGPTSGAAQSMYGPGYVSHPGDIMAGSAAAAGDVGGAVSTGQSAIQQVSGMYESAMTNVMSKFIDWMNITEKRKDRDLKAKTDKENRLLDILTATGGDWTDPETGQTHHFMSPEEQAALTARYREPTSTEKTEDRLESLAEDVRRGATLGDVMRTHGTMLDAESILQVYNVNSPYGPAKETAEELYEKFRVTPPARAPETAVEGEKGEIVGLIDELLVRDTKPITGFLRLGHIVPGTAAKTTLAKYNQLKGILSLENRQKLKGSGAISDYEMGILEQASSALVREMSDEDFQAELKKLRDGLGGGASGEWEVIE